MGEQNSIEEAMRTQVWKALMGSLINASGLDYIPNKCSFTEKFYYYFFPCFYVNHLLVTVLTKHDIRAGSVRKQTSSGGAANSSE